MTKPITKAECEEVIEKLADKTETFGCRGNAGALCLGGSWWLYPPYGYDDFQDAALVDNCDGVEILGHPVLIGDVLEKIDRGVSGMPYIPLLNLWGKCGFDSSLQQICNDAGWDNTNPQAEVKCKPAADLFTFLKSIL